MSKKAFSSLEERRGAGGTPADPDLGVEQVRAAVQGIRYGEVRVIIQDGVIVQIERVEKRRLR
jgi:hypothetical protein